MSYLREKVFRNYYSFYSQVTGCSNPLNLSYREMKRLDHMFGRLLTKLYGDGRVIDVGCGTGLILHWLRSYPKIIPIGVDISSTQIEVVRDKLPNIEVYCGDGIHFLESYNNEISGIFCMDMLEHLPKKDDCLKLLEAAKKALVPGGFFVCKVPNAANMTASYCRYIDLSHEISFTPPSLRQLFEISGFHRYEIIPMRPVHLADRIRLWVEASLHRLIFAICGIRQESVFTRVMVGIAFKDL